MRSQNIVRSNAAKNETWTLVERPSDKIVKTGKWVFKLKLNEEGKIGK